LPGPHGIGDLGASARQFIDFLAQTGQTLWQILPLSPTGYGNSPYMSPSAMAGNPLLISLEQLVEQGLLDQADLSQPPSFSEARVEFDSVIPYKWQLFMKAFDRFRENSYSEEYHAFCQQHVAWLDDFAFFVALKHAHGDVVWTQWDEGAAKRDPAALDSWRERLHDDIELHRFTQFIFFKQWGQIRDYCNERGIQIIGDIPIYVAHDSADVWAHPHLFSLDQTGNPTVIAGVPPDYFSTTGQRWGNPIYRWESMHERGYVWWIERFRMNFTLVDIVRLDHFRAFEGYWEIPGHEETAVNGQWVKGPGDDLFHAIRAALGDVNIIAEDLGVITAEVDALRDRLGFPGMRVLQMAFGADDKATEYRPHSYIHNCVAYTGTHDNDTTLGWFTAEPGTQTTQPAEEIEAERRSVCIYCNADGSDINWDMIHLASSSVADTAVFPLQDVLGLGTEGRMNKPGSGAGNWEWRMREGAITEQMRERLSNVTRVCGRWPD
jgi:4-alpha-glucanotransferase